jgi:serine/threonine kinase 32
MSKKVLVTKGVANNIIKELQILEEISYPFIVNLYFTFQDDQYIYMISDLLLGGDLRFHLSDGKFSEARVKLYICEIALAIDYLHSHQIIHRDIKVGDIKNLSNSHFYSPITFFSINKATLI